MRFDEQSRFLLNAFSELHDDVRLLCDWARDATDVIGQLQASTPEETESIQEFIRIGRELATRLRP